MDIRKFSYLINFEDWIYLTIILNYQKHFNTNLTACRKSASLTKKHTYVSHRVAALLQNSYNLWLSSQEDLGKGFERINKDYFVPSYSSILHKFRIKLQNQRKLFFHKLKNLNLNFPASIFEIYEFVQIFFFYFATLSRLSDPYLRTHFMFQW